MNKPILQRLDEAPPARHDDEWADEMAGKMTPHLKGAKFIKDVGPYELVQAAGDPMADSTFALTHKGKLASYIALTDTGMFNAVWSVHTQKEYRGKGLAEYLYRYVLDNVGALQTYTPLTTGSAGMWQKLAKDYHSYVIQGLGLKPVPDFSGYKHGFEDDPENKYHFVLSATPLEQ